jgi:hypothetical protein
MSYHLGNSATYVKFPVYGWWMISSPETRMQLRAVGIEVSDIPQATEMIASKTAPVFVRIEDRGSAMVVSYKYLGGSISGDVGGFNISQGIVPLREKLLRPSNVRTFSEQEVNILAEIPERATRERLTKENARQPGASPPANAPPAPPAPPAPADPGAAPAPAPATPTTTPSGPAPTSAKSNTGLYLGLGAGALLLLVGLGYWSTGR